MDFPWLSPTVARSQAPARLDATRREIATFAALLYRLGFTPAQATARIQDRIAWEYDQPTKGSHRRAGQLSDEGIAELVAATYARRPT